MKLRVSDYDLTKDDIEKIIEMIEKSPLFKADVKEEILNKLRKM